MVKIKFTGDIMCQIAQNEACFKGGKYDYSPVFEHAKKALGACDFLVGNLETPFAGKEMEYSNALYSFNSPDEFGHTVKETGFDLVSLANNHCMDRGVEGLLRTIQFLNTLGLEHIGVNTGAGPSFCVKEIGGIPLGFVAYTYGTNAFFHHRYIPKERKGLVNLLQPEELLEGSIDLLAEDLISQRVGDLYGKPNALFDVHIAPHLQKMKKDVEACRKAGAQFIIFILHCGGQYNAMPDAYTRLMAQYIQTLGVDAIVGHHPHVIHPLETIKGCPVAYSLGNFTYSPEASPRGGPLRGEYSALLCLTIDKDKGIVDISHEFMKSVVRKDGLSQVVPVEMLMEKACGEKRLVLQQDIDFCEAVLNNKRKPV